MGVMGRTSLPTCPCVVGGEHSGVLAVVELEVVDLVVVRIVVVVIVVVKVVIEAEDDVELATSAADAAGAGGGVLELDEDWL